MAVEAFGDPVTFDQLELKDGTVLHHVTIVAFGSATAMARWDGGRGTIRIDNLPDGVAPAAPRKIPAPAAPAATVGVPAKPGPPPEGAPDPNGARIFNTPWQNETQYIVETIASDLTEMAYYAKYRKALRVEGLPAVANYAPAAGSDGGLYFVVKSSLGEDGQCTCVLPITGAIWAPETYQPLTAALFAKLGLSGSPEDDSDTTEIVHGLLEPTVERLVSTDADESSKLAKSFTSAAAHERAALLMAVFESREEDGSFYQGLFELCRTTAHLSFARALSNKPAVSTAGKVATALLTLLYYNQAGALALADAFPNDEDSKAWRNVVRMRATFDYRGYKSSLHPSLAERFEYFRTLSYLDVDKAWGEIHMTKDDAPKADWWRIAGTRSSSVQLGHLLLSQRISVELREAKTAYDAETLSSFTTAGIRALNAEPCRCVTSDKDGEPFVRIIGWGTWAAFEQRHLCSAVSADFHFLEHMWGVPDMAADFRKQADDQFWELRLYPLVRRHNATEKSYYHQAQDDELVLVRNCPQALPAGAWNIMSFAPKGLDLYIPPPSPAINEWHNPNPPPGTAYDIAPRLHHPSLISRADFLEELERLHALAPYDPTIAYQLIYKKYSTRPTPAQVEEVYRNVLDFDPRPCLWIASLSKRDPQSYLKWLRKAIGLNPKYGRILATYFAGKGRDEEAAKEYEQWLDAKPDDVSVASEIEWLVQYKERHGDEAGANALAKQAYDTGSAKGMETMAHLVEGRKFYEAAYRIYSEERERYNEGLPMLAFLERMHLIGSDSSRDAMRDSLAKTYIPGGLLPEPAPGNQPPTYGVEMDSSSDETDVCDLQWHDVIVAANGYRTPDSNTLQYIKHLNAGKDLTLTVWRDGKYLTLTAHLAHFVPYNLPTKNYKG